MQGPKLYVLTTVQIIAAIALLWWVFSRPGGWDGERIAGTVLILVGLSGIVAARYQLGRSFAIKPEARELVTRGLYSKIRNPIYVFGVVAISGLVLVARKPALWFLVAAIIAAQTVRARQEARVLEAAFGDAYREYRRKTCF